MSVILHVRQVGHKCRNPLQTPPASYIKAGEVLQLGDWNLWYSDRAKAYRIHSSTPEQRLSTDREIYQFTNFNCAAAKLAELGA